MTYDQWKLASPYDDSSDDGPVCGRCGGNLSQFWSPYRLACDYCENEDAELQSQADGNQTLIDLEDAEMMLASLS